MIVIIGHGAAGYSAMRTLRALDPGIAVTMIAADRDGFYSRIDLPDVIKGTLTPEQAVRLNVEQMGALGVRCLAGETVTRILPAARQIELASGQRIPYGKLLLATGSRPILPPLPGMDAVGIHTLWTLEDARRIRRAALAAQTAVVVGAGFIGLKTALALRGLGLDVTVIEQLPGLMPRQLDATASDMVADRLRGAGLHLLTATAVESVLADRGTITGVQANGKTIACDLLVCAAGVQPNARLAMEAELDVGLGIAVDAGQRTSDPHIFAAGDVAESRDCLTGACLVPAIWPAAVEQGRVAAYNMKGRPLPAPACLTMNAVEIAGLPVVAFGEVHAGPGDQVLSRVDKNAYHKVIVHNDVPRGVLCLGDIRQAGVLGNMVQQKTPLGGVDPLSAGFDAFSRLADVPLPGWSRPSMKENPHAH